MRLVMSAIFASLLLSSSANAGITIYKIGRVCPIDIEQYCKGISTKKLRDLKECLRQHEKQLLPYCQDHYKDSVS